MTEDTYFTNTFKKYKDIQEKYDSLYIFVVNGMMIDEFIEKIKKIITTFDSISNPVKKSHLKQRLGNFIEQLNIVVSLEPNKKLECIYFVHSTVDNYPFVKYWKETLRQFDCRNMYVSYDITFQLDWLNSLIIDRSFIHILHVKNHDMKHVHLNKTKKRVHTESSKKTMDIQLYIQENIPKSDICIVHGVSALIKNIVPNDNTRVFNGDKKDEELVEEYEKIINGRNASALQWHLDRILDPKEGNKLAFGKDIGIGISEKMIKTVYCSPERRKKILENYSSDDIIFDIIVVKSYGDDVGKRLVTDFKGAIGIKFY